MSPRCSRDSETGTLRPRVAATRSLLCGHCRDRLDQQLRTLPELYVDIEQARAPGGRTPGSPLGPKVAPLRAAIRGALASWSQLVVAERKVARPIRNVAGMAEFLRRHVDWLGAHPAAAEISGEIGELVLTATQLTRTAAARCVVVAKCANPDCVGDLVAWIHDAHSPAEITCTHHSEHAWPTDRWGRLRSYLNVRPERDSA